MSRFVELLSSRHVPHLAVLALVSVGFGGCSADTQSRFADTSFSNPFASRSADATGSVQQGYQRPPELPQYHRRTARR